MQLTRKGLSHRAKNHHQHHVVLIENVSWKYRQKSTHGERQTSAKRNLMSVGGCTDTPLDLVVAGNVDGKHPCLDNGQTVLMRGKDLSKMCTIVTDNMVKDDDVQVSSSNLDINVSGRCYRQKHRTTTIQ